MSKSLKLIFVLLILITITTSTFAMSLNILQEEQSTSFRQNLEDEIQKVSLRYKIISIIRNISFLIMAIYIYT